ncbi:M56 family metallopeptidase [uncultured Parabacteroides sp.]|uniref:M56 family metallopeptidase n=1 Tax=uncultured Parabacteroides sp. TaxID=512312 RepID=UPI0025ECB758|nr:M56 family metallopeptidase [uncultured Parabacteroides sp.]
MGTFLVFLLKSTCCLAAFYLFYRLLLSRDTFHRFNRLALLGVIVFSVAIPFIRLVTDEPVAVQRTVLDIEQLLLMAAAPVEETATGTGELPFWLTALFAVYISGCVFFAGRFLYSVGQIIGLIRSGEVTVLDGGVRLVVTDRPVSPFSWMRYIVISRIDMEESGAEIVTHERAHIEAWHSLDMWLAGACVVLHWFNPAAWLLKQELQNVHEFEADEAVILHGVDTRHYQLLLIKKAVGSQRFTSMANSFNHSKLKKRIAMMLKQKSNPWARLKYLYVLPLAAVAVAAFARPEISRSLEKISAVNVPEFLPVTEADPVIEAAPVIPRQAREESVPQDTVRVVGYGDMPTNVVVVDSLVPRPLFVIDGVEMPDFDSKTLDPSSISSISVLKDMQSIKLYGTKGQHGVILVTTKKISDARPENALHGTIDNIRFRRLEGVKLRPAPGPGSHPAPDPIVLVDGKEIPYDKLDEINPDRVKVMSIIKDESVSKKYGDKYAGRGVIEITLKKEYE